MTSPPLPMPSRALLAVDVQFDFLPGGALAVPHGDQVVDALRTAMDTSVNYFIASQDYHPADHISFVGQGGLWPPHCVAGTHGAKLHPAIELLASVKFLKGQRPMMDAYSAFQGTSLATWLRERNVTELLVGGLATEYCVKATVLDALNVVPTVIVLMDACRSISPIDGVKAFDEMKRMGALLR